MDDAAPSWSMEVRAPEARPIFQQVDRAIALTERLNRLPYADQDAIRAAWAELTNTEIDSTFRLIPPVYSDQGVNIRVGRNVFINHSCTLNDIGGIVIGDEVFVGPRVSLITSGHPVDPAFRRRQIVAAPIVIERGVWICTGATILHGVDSGRGLGRSGGRSGDARRPARRGRGRRPGARAALSLARPGSRLAVSARPRAY